MPIMTDREQEILDETVDVIKRYLKPKRIWLFGSRAQGKASPTSDFDFAVETEEKDQRIRRKVKGFADVVSGLYKIDIVYFDDVEKEFSNLILKTGRVVYEQ